MKFTIILSIIVFSSCIAQNNKTSSSCSKNDIKFINNKSLDYSIVILSCDTCAPIKNIGYRVITNLNSSQEKIIKGITQDCWLQLLSDEKTDWAANLILYEIYKKDALLLSRSNELDWRKYLKKEDLEDWSGKK